MENNDNDEDFFNGLFSPVEQIFADFDRFFSDFSSIFSIPSEDFNKESSQPSTSLRDEVLKQDVQTGDINLDSSIEEHGLYEVFPRTFSSSSMMTTTQRETTPSGRCVIEKKIQHSSNQNQNNKTETISKICGEKYHTTIKENGKVIREYGNSTVDELDQIDSSPNDDDGNRPILDGNRHSDFFKRLFS